MESRHDSTICMTYLKMVVLQKLLTNWHNHKNDTLSSLNAGFPPAAASASSIAILSSTVRLSSDSRNTGGSDIRARRIRLSSSADTGRQALSSNGICIMMRYFGSKRVCSTPRQCSHKEDKPRPAKLRSTLHNRHRAYPSTTRLCRGKPTKVLCPPLQKQSGLALASSPSYCELQ